MQVHEVAPGHFNATTSDRIDKMYAEVSCCNDTKSLAEFTAVDTFCLCLVLVFCGANEVGAAGA